MKDIYKFIEELKYKLINIKKIGDDYGGDNLLFRYNIEKLPKLITENIENEMYDINSDFEWYHYESYDNMDFNGHFFETIYIDKDDLFHKMEEDKVIITDDFIYELIESDLENILKGLLYTAEGNNNE